MVRAANCRGLCPGAGADAAGMPRQSRSAHGLPRPDRAGGCAGDRGRIRMIGQAQRAGGLQGRRPRWCCRERGPGWGLTRWHCSERDACRPGGAGTGAGAHRAGGLAGAPERSAGSSSAFHGPYDPRNGTVLRTTVQGGGAKASRDGQPRHAWGPEGVGARHRHRRLGLGQGRRRGIGPKLAQRVVNELKEKAAGRGWRWAAR